jgi:diguanylate cyclase (GGDEF)-like protein
VDADHFKRINDEYGHVAGDQVLRQLARHMQRELRRSDLATRYGGEEFALVLPQTDAREAMSLAERIRSRLASLPIPIDASRCVSLSVSIGVATLSGRRHGSPAALAREILDSADRAVYRAKAAGRNTVRGEEP